MRPVPYFTNIVLQPTSLCNLNCRYCYLPNRNKKNNMLIDVTKRLASQICDFDQTVSLIWHGGEPLACGVDYFEQLVEPFARFVKNQKVIHHIQTNATLIDERWVDFFLRHRFHVGVSLDGPDWATKDRMNWSGKAAFADIMRGINILKEANIGYSIISVVGEHSLGRATELYEFLCDTGCVYWGINFAEKENYNEQDSVDDDVMVREFWSDLFIAWRSNPVISVREFNNVMAWMQAVCDDRVNNYFTKKLDLLPTIAWNGDVVFLSPELAGSKAENYHDFVVGNVLKTSLKEMIGQFSHVPYVQEFIEGIDACRQSCDYFSFCGGGQASNKFYELDTFSGTETVYCRNAKKRLVDIVIDNL